MGSLIFWYKSYAYPVLYIQYKQSGTKAMIIAKIKSVLAVSQNSKSISKIANRKIWITANNNNHGKQNFTHSTTG